MASVFKPIFFLLLVNQASWAAPKKVLTTTNILYDVVKVLAQDDFEIQSLMGPGVDPHLYKATANDLKKLRQAELVIANGLYLEGKMLEALRQLAKRKPVVFVAEQLPKSRILFSQAAADPHVWFDPELWIECSSYVEAALSKLAPEKSKSFKQRQKAWALKVRQLAQQYREKFSRIQKDKRLLITSHDAFSYLGRYFGMEVMGIQGMSTESEAGLKDLKNVIDTVKRRKLPAIFVESSVPKQSIERVQEKSGVRIGGELFSDALGAADSKEGSYLGALSHNLETIYKGLSQ